MYIFAGISIGRLVVKKHLPIDVNKYFSGEMDNKLFLIGIFENPRDVTSYLKAIPSAHSGYVLCMDQSLDEIIKIKKAGKGFGEHIIKAINFHNYIMTTWENQPLPPQKVEVLNNPNNQANNHTSPSVMI